MRDVRARYRDCDPRATPPAMNLEEADAALTIEVTDKLTTKTQTVSLAVGELKTINMSEDPNGLVHYSMVSSFRGNTYLRFDHDGNQLARPVRGAELQASDLQFLPHGLFNHLVGKREHVDRHDEPHRLGRLEIQDQVVSGGRL
jgi:hypothetical protein